MSVISSGAPDRLLPPRVAAAASRIDLRQVSLVDLPLAAVVVAMLVAMVQMPGQETIPYHVLFLAVTLVYGYRVWPMVPTMVVVGTITLSTGWVMVTHYRSEEIDAPELAEVPLMPLLLLAMVWHARRRVAAQRQVELMADERRASLEREREFLRDASHAIRTPVTIARGHLELIEETLVDPTARDDAGVVVRQLDRMSALANRLLALARLDSGNALNAAPLDVAALVDEVGRNWSSSADRCWQVDARPLGTIVADGEWIEMALDAIVENAVRFTRPGGQVRLSCSRRGGMCVISVADTGPGIDPADLPFVFDRFWHRQVSESPPGSGLGLSMAQAAALAHRGFVRASNLPGGGAVFEISLPARDASRPS